MEQISVVSEWKMFALQVAQAALNHCLKDRRSAISHAELGLLEQIPGIKRYVHVEGHLRNGCGFDFICTLVRESQEDLWYLATAEPTPINIYTWDKRGPTIYGDPQLVVSKVEPRYLELVFKDSPLAHNRFHELADILFQ